MGSREGVLKVAAGRLGISVGEYRDHIARGEKHCGQCRVWRPVKDFHIDISRASGHATICMACRSVHRGPSPSQAERKQRRKIGLAWCRDCKSWLAEANVRGGICRMHSAERERARYRSDPRFRADRQQRSGSRKRGLDPMPFEAMGLLMSDYGGLCAYCRSRPATTWDHIEPVKHRGRTVPGNMVPACGPCNSSKRDRDFVEWMTAKGFGDRIEAIFDRLSLTYVHGTGID